MPLCSYDVSNKKVISLCCLLISSLNLFDMGIAHLTAKDAKDALTTKDAKDALAG